MVSEVSEDLSTPECWISMSNMHVMDFITGAQRNAKWLQIHLKDVDSSGKLLHIRTNMESHERFTSHHLQSHLQSLAGQLQKFRGPDVLLAYRDGPLRECLVYRVSFVWCRWYRTATLGSMLGAKRSRFWSIATAARICSTTRPRSG